MDNKHLAGTFWSQVIDDELYQHFLAAREIAEDQTQVDLRTLAACAGRATTPLYRRVLLQPLTISKPEGCAFTGCAAPAKLVAVPMITDRIVNPETIWLHNIDFVLENGQIIFRNDPFTLVEDQKPVYTDRGHVEGTEIVLWLHGADYDERYIHDLWGTVVGLSAPSSEEYHTLVNIAYEAILGGTSRKHIERLVATLNGIPLAKGNETILEIGEDDKGSFVASDRHIYRASGAKSLVQVGTHVKTGDPLFDNFHVYLPTADVSETQLPEITIPKNWLDQISGDLTFVNKDVPLYKKGACTYFDVAGEKLAVEHFQAIFGLCNLPDGRRLGDLLDGKETINPCKFIRQNVLRNCLLFVLHSPKTPPSLTGIDQERLMRALVPPHTALLVVKS